MIEKSPGNVMGRTALVFVGHSKERLIESIRHLRKYPPDHIILATGEQESSGEKRSRGIAAELKKDLSAFFEDTAIVRFDKKDIMRAAGQIIQLIRKENANGRDVVLNLSGSLRTFAIAAFIAGCITRSKMITAIPAYDKNDSEIGIESVIDLPALPLNLLKPEQVRILAAVSDGVESLDELVVRLNGTLKKDSGAFAKERSRLSHHLKNFEEIGMIEKEKKGKNVRVKLTPLGEMMTCES